MDREHEHDPHTLVGWAFAARPDEADRILARMNGCGRCAAEAARLRGAARLLSALDPVAPPAELRARVLARARRAAPVPAQTLAYAGQVAAMDALLADLSPDDWRASVVPLDRDVRGLVAHLSANDAMVAADVGRAAAHPPGPRDAWRAGATLLLDEVRPRGDDGLDEPVRMAGRRPATRPLRDGLIQRAFETWIHADDIRTAVGLPPRPPPQQHVHLIADLGARLLPIALAATGAARPGLARLRLDGPGGGEWDVPLGAEPASGDPVAVITMDAVEFCRLLAGRRTPADAGYDAAGDASVARTILHAATTLGCE